MATAATIAHADDSPLGWTVDRAAFKRIARDVFGLDRPVALAIRHARRSIGSHSSTAERHNVRLSPLHAPTVRRLCETLAHELWHCLEVEEMPFTEYVKQNRAESRLYPYETRPREVRAREAEQLWQELLPCITTTRKGA
jgi:hypothetical protein